MPQLSGQGRGLVLMVQRGRTGCNRENIEAPLTTTAIGFRPAFSVSQFFAFLRFNR